MSRLGSLSATVGAVLTAVVLAACGGGGSARNASDLQLDPASKVPASVVAYASITIKPQGSLKADLTQTIDKLAGPGASQHLMSDFTRALGNDRAKFDQLEKWTGPQIGVALTAIPQGQLNSAALKNNLLVVIPTSNPSAAKAYISKQKPSQGASADVVGHYVIAGGSAAVTAAAATSLAQSLANDPGYRSAVDQLNDDQLATAFVRARPLLQALAAGGTGAGGGPARARQFSKALQTTPADSVLALGVGAGTKLLRLDLVAQGFPQSQTSGQPGDVGSLPSGTWFGLKLNPSAQMVEQLTAALPAAGKALTLTSQPGFLPFLQQDLLPALGPISLSIGGSSLLNTRLGAVLTPYNAAAGDRLLAAIKRLLKSVPVPITATKQGNQLIVKYGYASAEDFMAPTSHLSGDPAYKAALAQLPPGSKVPLYVRFAPLVPLVSLLDQGASSASTRRILGKLDYLILGDTGTHLRLVLSVK